jgi:hypothetical protein
MNTEVGVDYEKKLELETQKDKLQNPLKYIFLQRKGKPGESKANYLESAKSQTEVEPFQKSLTQTEDN